MKAHIGVDARSGLVHMAGVTSGSVHDATVMDLLIRDDDTTVYGDKGYNFHYFRTNLVCRSGVRR
jgi:transposase, IS5 family